MTRDDRPPALVCRQTGSIRSVAPCMAWASGACGYCGIPAPEVDERARMDAVLDEREQLTVEGLR